MERTLCQPPTKNESEVQFFYVDVSTLSPINTTYQLRVSRMDDFVLRSAGESEGATGLASFPSSGSNGGGLFSALQDRRAVQLQYYGSTAPGKTSLSKVPPEEKWGSLNLGVGVVSSLCQEFQVGCTLRGGLSRNRSTGPKVVGDRQYRKCRDRRSGCHLSYLPLGHCPECPAEVEGSGVWEMDLLVGKAFLPREPPLPNPGRIHTLPF